jgi:hypothetical protein
VWVTLYAALTHALVLAGLVRLKSTGVAGRTRAARVGLNAGPLWEAADRDPHPKVCRDRRAARSSAVRPALASPRRLIVSGLPVAAPRCSAVAATGGTGERELELTISGPMPAELGLRDRVQAVIFAYESVLAHPGPKPADREMRDRG